MCILNDGELERRILLPDTDPQRIVFSPFDRAINLQPASLDMRLGRDLIISNEGGDFVWNLENCLAVLLPGRCVLATTYERLGVPADLSMQMGGKSSIGRNFVIIHCTAGFHDPGFGITGGEPNESTLEIVNLSHKPFTLTYQMPICQAVFSTLTAPAVRPYKGKYTNQRGGPAPDRTPAHAQQRLILDG